MCNLYFYNIEDSYRLLGRCNQEDVKSIWDVQMWNLDYLLWVRPQMEFVGGTGTHSHAATANSAAHGDYTPHPKQVKTPTSTIKLSNRFNTRLVGNMHIGISHSAMQPCLLCEALIIWREFVHKLSFLGRSHAALAMPITNQDYIHEDDVGFVDVQMFQPHIISSPHGNLTPTDDIDEVAIPSDLR